MSRISARKALLAQLETEGVEGEAIFSALDALRAGLIEAIGTLEGRSARSA